ncbi:MAG: zinc-ribbon domain-containing protein [Eubacterium sp.]
MSYKICPNCGSEIDSGREICPNCGTGLASVRIINDDVTDEELYNENNTYQNQYNNNFQEPQGYGYDPYNDPTITFNPAGNQGGAPITPTPAPVPEPDDDKNANKKANGIIIGIVIAIVVAVAIIIGVLASNGLIGGTKDDDSDDDTTVSTTTTATTAATTTEKPTSTTVADNIATEVITTGAPCTYTFNVTLPTCVNIYNEYVGDTLSVYVNNEYVDSKDVTLDGRSCTVTVEGEADAKTQVTVALSNQYAEKEYTFYGSGDESKDVDFTEISYNDYEEYGYSEEDDYYSDADY